eukprot:scaffold197600_cov40-Attheya_sp.AAC.1
MPYFHPDSRLVPWAGHPSWSFHWHVPRTRQIHHLPCHIYVPIVKILPPEDATDLWANAATPKQSIPCTGAPVRSTFVGDCGSDLGDEQAHPPDRSSAATSDAARATVSSRAQGRTNKPELTLSHHGLCPIGKFVAKAASESGAPPGVDFEAVCLRVPLPFLFCWVPVKICFPVIIFLVCFPVL